MIIFPIIFLFVFLILSGIVWLFYWIPKKIGYPWVGKILAGVVGIFFIVITFLSVFEDQLFSKRDALKLLAHQDIVLNDAFTLSHNKSTWAIGADYYHTFTLKISAEDKARLIHDIVSAKDFNPKIQESSMRYSGEENYYNGPKSIKYYETETQYVKELFEPQGEGYAPIYRKIELDKQNNLLIFEDIAE